MLEHDGVAGAAGRRAHGVIHHVEQLADGDGGRPAEIRSLVAAGVRDDQVVLRGQQCVQEELTILASHVAVTDPLTACREIVAVPLDVTGEAPVVEPEETHHPVRDGAHRHEGAHGQVPGAEIGPRRPPLEALGENGADVVATEGDRADGAIFGGFLDQLLEQPVELRPLPGVTRRRRHEGVRDVRQRGAPVPHRAQSGQRVEPGLEPMQELGQPPGQVDVTAVDVVQRECRAEEALPVLGHGHPEEDPVEPGLPGVRCNALELERAPMGGIESPSDERAAHPLLQAVQVVVAEAETAAHRIASGQVEHLGRRDPRRRKFEHLGQHAHHRVGLAEGTVRQADFERPLRIGRRPLESPPAERGLNQRCERLDVGAHHDDVAGLQARIVLQQVQDGVAQHFDLAAPSMAGVDPDAVVVRGQHRPLVDAAAGAPRRSAVGADVVLHAAAAASAPPDGARRAPSSPCGTAEPRTSCISRASRPHDCSSGCRARRRWGPRPGAGGATSAPPWARAVPTAPATGAAGRGGRPGLAPIASSTSR